MECALGLRRQDVCAQARLPCQIHVVEGARHRRSPDTCGAEPREGEGGGSTAGREKEEGKRRGEREKGKGEI